MRISTHIAIAALAAIVFVATAVAATNLGQPLTLDKTTPIPTVLTNPDSYVGKTLQVKGKVSAVCEMAGCWMNLVDASSGKSIRIKVNDGEIVFPQEAIGKLALAEGKLEKLELTKEQAIAQAKHHAEETGKPFDPKSVTGPKTIIQIRGTGAKILD